MRTLNEFLEAKNIPGIEGIDTRKLTRIIRNHGSLKGKLTNAGEEVNVDQVVKELQTTEIPNKSSRTSFNYNVLIQAQDVEKELFL